MKKLIQVLFLILLSILLAGVVILRAQQPQTSVADSTQSAVTESAAGTAQAPTGTGISAPAVSATQVPVAATPEPTPTPTPTPTPEPTPELFTISVIGDQTLTSHQMLSDQSEYSYAGRMNGDYSYPFKNTVQYFKDDEFTISNLECTLSDTQMYSPQQFYFRAPAANAQILTLGGVDFVTTANNHSLDFGQAGLLSTYAALEEYGLDYGKEDDYKIVTTEHGLYSEQGQSRGGHSADEGRRRGLYHLCVPLGPGALLSAQCHPD